MKAGIASKQKLSDTARVKLVANLAKARAAKVATAKRMAAAA
jgi:hypothetical protein